MAAQSPNNNNNNNNKVAAKLPISEPKRPVSPTTKLTGEAGGRGRRAQIDSGSLSQEMVARIYQEELSKLARAAEKSGNIAECTMYQQELSRLVQNVHKQRKHSQESNSRRDDKENKKDMSKEDEIKREKGEDLRIKREPSEEERRGTPDSSCITPHRRPSSEEAMMNHEALRHAGSAFFLVRPRSNSHPAFPEPSVFPMMPGDPVSPLQRMQSIANSLMTRTHPSHQSQRPLRAVLPPITQESFDRYSNLNTDDVVKQVKDTLGQYSISQRLFGEHVLGLSQGSVSDLLARPKPWHMLTQKGREPFIRMQLFLEDHEAIPNLVANQYHISPDKLLRRNSSFDFQPSANPPSTCEYFCHSTQLTF